MNEDKPQIASSSGEIQARKKFKQPTHSHHIWSGIVGAKNDWPIPIRAKDQSPGCRDILSVPRAPKASLLSNRLSLKSKGQRTWIFIWYLLSEPSKNETGIWNVGATWEAITRPTLVHIQEPMPETIGGEAFFFQRLSCGGIGGVFLATL